MNGTSGENPAVALPNTTSPLSVEIRVSAAGGEDRCCATPATKPVGEVKLRYLVLVIVWVISGVYAGVQMGRGWVPADDGILAESALRVMHGQLPHRDFVEIYTGGLNFIHAAAFRLFGVNLMSMRICVFLFFLAWIPAVYWIVLRFTPAISAGLITLVAVAWSYPNYPAAMPSWYNLFFATFGSAALLRYLEVRTRRWLFIAGVCGGVSVLIKVIGAYYIAGALLFLAFPEQSDVDGRARWGRGSIYRVASGLALLLFLAILVLVLRARLGISELYEFVLPSAVVVGMIFAVERHVEETSSGRFRTLLHSTVPFLSGVLLPILAFLAPYASVRAIFGCFNGVTSSAVSHSQALGVLHPVGPLQAAYYALPVIAILLAGMYWDKFQSLPVGAALGLGGIAIIFRATESGAVASGIWCSIGTLTPLAVILGAALVLTKKEQDEQARKGRQQIVLLISLAAICSLVQYPFPAPIYLSYAVPLTLLALVAIVATGKKQRATYVAASLLSFYLLFGVVILVPHHIYELTHVVGHMDTMRSGRSGGLKIEGAAFFDDLAMFLRAHSPNGKMYAGNDCPELYFLSRLQNVTTDDAGFVPDEALKTIRRNDLYLVVLNDAPYFPSGQIGPEVRAEVAQRFPNSARFGIFEVFWRQ